MTRADEMDPTKRYRSTQEIIIFKEDGDEEVLPAGTMFTILNAAVQPFYHDQIPLVVITKSITLCHVQADADFFEEIT